MIPNPPHLELPDELVRSFIGEPPRTGVSIGDTVVYMLAVVAVVCIVIGVAHGHLTTAIAGAIGLVLDVTITLVERRLRARR